MILKLRLILMWRYISPSIQSFQNGNSYNYYLKEIKYLWNYLKKITYHWVNGWTLGAQNWGKRTSHLSHYLFIGIKKFKTLRRSRVPLLRRLQFQFPDDRLRRFMLSPSLTDFEIQISDCRSRNYSIIIWSNSSE